MEDENRPSKLPGGLGGKSKGQSGVSKTGKAISINGVHGAGFVKKFEFPQPAGSPRLFREMGLWYA